MYLCNNNKIIIMQNKQYVLKMVENATVELSKLRTCSNNTDHEGVKESYDKIAELFSDIWTIVSNEDGQTNFIN